MNKTAADLRALSAKNLRASWDADARCVTRASKRLAELGRAQAREAAILEHDADQPRLIELGADRSDIGYDRWAWALGELVRALALTGRKLVIDYGRTCDAWRAGRTPREHAATLAISPRGW